jgi:hypothetical protein
MYKNNAINRSGKDDAYSALRCMCLIKVNEKVDMLIGAELTRNPGLTELMKLIEFIKGLDDKK